MPDGCPKRPPAYYLAAGLDLHREMTRLCGLPVLGGESGELARRLPELTVRRAARRPRNRVGFAIPDEWRISVTTYPGVRRGDLEETLLHELVHLALGAGGGTRRWHGAEFKATLRRAMGEAYGLRGVRPANTYHGAYADALERRRAHVRVPHPGQLSLQLAAP
jgi:hypothetical protein